MGYIFISYSRKQLYFAESVNLHIERTGLETWFDLQQLRPGMDWASGLKKGYGNCDQLVFIASEAAIESPYVQVEWETVLNKGREVVVVLTENVALPDSLKDCALYDARVHFDQTIQSLIAYLRGEQLARHDAIPAPGKFPLPLKMPFDIWLTLFVLILPAITTLIATLIYPAATIKSHLIGVSISILLLIFFPIYQFWSHNIPQKRLLDLRGRLLVVQLAASLWCTYFAISSVRTGQPVNPIIFLIYIFPLVSAYWAFRIPRHSADILRWFHSGDVDQNVRGKIEGSLVREIEKHSSGGKISSKQVVVTYAIHHHAADLPLAEYVGSAIRSETFRPAGQGVAQIHLIIVTNRTSRRWLLECNDTLSGKIVYILSTNINMPAELESTFKTQWVDFRTESKNILQTLRDQLTRQSGANVTYGLEVSPTAFDRFVIPRPVLILGGIIAFVGLRLINFGWNFFTQGGWMIVLFGIALIVFYTMLLLRKTPLPAFFHKIMGNRAAWFAAPAESAEDAIGNNTTLASLSIPFYSFFSRRKK